VRATLRRLCAWGGLLTASEGPATMPGTHAVRSVLTRYTQFAHGAGY
jgi:hypothetical protein